MRMTHRTFWQTECRLLLSLSLMVSLLGVGRAAAQGADAEEARWRTGYIPMQDGTKLAYILHRPRKGEKFPVLINYNGELGGALTLGPEEREYLPDGYAVLGVSFRGTGSSEGAFSGPLAPQHGEDGKAIVEWAGQQPWCDGNVALYGNLTAGFSALQVAAHHPKYLKALAVGRVWDDSYEDVAYPGGLFNFGLVGQWSYHTQPYLSARSARLRQFTGDLAGAKRRAAENSIGKTYDQMRTHPLKDDWWQARSLDPVIPRIETSTLIFQAWQDPQVAAAGALRVFQKLPAPKRIVLANGGDTVYEQVPLTKLRLRWFDRWLKGKSNRVDQESPITIWFEVHDPRRPAKNAAVPMSNTSKKTPANYTPPPRVNPPAILKPAWVSSFSTWPIPEVQWSTLYLTAEGKLGPAKPATPRQSGQRFYLYPAGTEIVSSNETFSAPAAPLGCLVYRTDPLTDDLAIVGCPVLTLYASSEQNDTAFMAVLHDVNPQGQATYVQRGVLRASHRVLDPKKTTPHEPSHRHDKAEGLTPGQVYEIQFNLFPVAQVLRRGHLLELAIMAPPCIPSPSWAFTPLTPGLNTIYHSTRYPSKLEIPVAPGIKAQAAEPPLGSLPFQPAREAPARSWDSERKNLEDILRAWKDEKLLPG